MTDTQSLIDKLEPLIKEHFDEETQFVPGESTISLSKPTFDEDEVLEAIESLLSTWVTMGDKVDQFEEDWSDYVDTSHARMVNSGSSANLLALKSLEDRIEPGDEVIVPAVSWSTSVFPILDCGATPVFVDVNPETYTIDVDALEAAISEQTAAVVLVHLLGNPCEMGPIMEICEANDIAVVEDCCEAHGARYDGKNVGTFGDVGTFSFFFSHHISTIEGGIVVTDSAEIDEDVTLRRAHGWVRELDDERREKYTSEHPDIDERFLFAKHGYNLRPMEIQGAFGIHQVDKLEEFVEKRRGNAHYLNDELEPYTDSLELLRERPNTRCSWFAYPIKVRETAPFDAQELQNYLESNNVETRPMLAGNLVKQPVMQELPAEVHGELDTADDLHENGLFVGNHHGLRQAELDYIVDIIGSFIESNR